MVIEQIADLRVRSGRWTLNKSREVVGEPPVPGGDDAIIVMRQDMACGTTIGPITAASLAARTVDIGCPMWGMHSSCETLGAHDLAAMTDVMRVFFVGGA